MRWKAVDNTRGVGRVSVRVAINGLVNKMAASESGRFRVSKVSHLVRTDAGLTRKLGGWRPCGCQTIEVEIGRVLYARNCDVRLAYRILGDGDTTLVWVPGWISNVDLFDEPQTAFTAFFEQPRKRGSSCGTSAGQGCRTR